jgi:hypothetical protein
MARLSKFVNAPIANLRRRPPKLFIRKADKKFQKKKKMARGRASERPEMSDPESSPGSGAAVIPSLVAAFSRPSSFENGTPDHGLTTVVTWWC